MQKSLRIAGMLLVLSCAVHAQTARLTEHTSGLSQIEAEPGDTLLIDVTAELGRYQAAGITIFLQVSSDGFRILEDDAQGGPFVPGGLFADGLVVRNQQVADSHTILPAGHRLLEFTTLLGPVATSQADRARSRSGSIACFRVLCERTVSGTIRLHHSPVFESRIVLADGRTEMPLLLAPPVEIDVDRQTSITPAPWGLLKVLRRATPR